MILSKCTIVCGWDAEFTNKIIFSSTLGSTRILSNEIKEKITKLV